MKPTTMHFLLFSLLIGLLGALPLVAQHDTGQDPRREPREQFLPFQKRLPHPDLSGLPDPKHESLPAEGTQAGDVLQRLPERLRERLERDWDLSEIEGLTDSKQPRFTDKPAPSSSHTSPEAVTDGSALQMVSSDSVVVDWIADYTSGVSGDQVATALAVDGSGNVYVTGRSAGSGTYEDYATVKYNASGVEQWVARYNGPGNSADEARALAVDGSGNVYVTGSATFADGQRYTTIKYRQITTGIAEEPELPREFGLYQNYPNPFNPSTVIRYQLPVTSRVTLRVHSVLGQEVARLVDEVQAAGFKMVEWNASGMPSGVYLVRMSAEGEGKKFSDVKKLMLVK